MQHRARTQHITRVLNRLCSKIQGRHGHIKKEQCYQCWPVDLSSRLVVGAICAFSESAKWIDPYQCCAGPFIQDSALWHSVLWDSELCWDGRAAHCGHTQTVCLTHKLNRQTGEDFSLRNTCMRSTLWPNMGQKCCDFCHCALGDKLCMQLKTEGSKIHVVWAFSMWVLSIPRATTLN